MTDDVDPQRNAETADRLTSSNNGVPTISIVSGHCYRQDDVDRFLQSAAEQRDGGIEVVLADAVSNRDIEEPNVRRIALAGHSLPALRAAALRMATGDLIAVVDPDVRLSAGWASVVRARLASAQVVCGPVRYDGGPSLITRAAFLAEYGAFEPPSGLSAGVAGTNVAFRRSCLNQIGAFSGPFHKAAVIHRLVRSGVTPVYEPEMLVDHRRPWTFFAFLNERFRLGRSFATQRQAGPLERLCRALAAPVVGFVLFARLGWRVWPKNAGRAAFVAAAPATLSFLTSWAIGEGVGYLCGPGEAREG